MTIGKICFVDFKPSPLLGDVLAKPGDSVYLMCTVSSKFFMQCSSSTKFCMYICICIGHFVFFGREISPQVNSTFESCKWFNPEHHSCEFEWVREIGRIVRRDCEIAEKVNSLKGTYIFKGQNQSIMRITTPTSQKAERFWGQQIQSKQ